MFENFYHTTHKFTQTKRKLFENFTTMPTIIRNTVMKHTGLN